MNITRRSPLALAAAWLLAASVGFAQSLYLVTKSQNFFQTSDAGAVVHPSNAFSFQAKMATNGTFTLPAGGSQPLISVPSSQDFELSQSFASKTALDAAFPNGVFHLATTGLPTLAFSFTPETYTAATPQVVNGTWSSGGLLVVDPAQSTTINFSSFADYSAAGGLGHLTFEIQSLAPGSFPKMKLETASQSVLGITPQNPAPTSYTIPAQTLTAGAVYVAGLNFDLAQTLDTTSVPGGAAISLFSKKVVFYIVAKASSSVLPAAPAITLQPIDRTGAVGGSVTLCFSANAPGASLGVNASVLWWRNGQLLDLGDQTKYGFIFNTNGSSLTINNLTADDAGSYFAQLITSGGVVTTVPVTLAVAAAAPPTVTVQSSSAAVASGGMVTLSATASGTAPTYLWRFNGTIVEGATTASLPVMNVQPATTGLYTVVATTASGFSPATTMIGVASTAKVIGAGAEIGADITAPNKNVYDQVLLSGPAATITADPGQVTRTSFIDLTDDIVQVEFAGAGTLSLVLDNPSGPAAPLNYNQPTVSYMKGHVGIVITGANETTNVSVFSVGHLNAFDPTGAFDTTLPASATNDPAKNGSSLFVGHATTAYDGVADLAFIAIASTNGKFGGLRASNASFYATKGLTGVFAPNVQFTGPVFVGDINASGTATPVLFIGSSGDTRITGGDLLQSNGQPVKTLGLTQLKFTDGVTSHNVLLPAQANKAHLDQGGVDVTVRVVSNPP